MNMFSFQTAFSSRFKAVLSMVVFAAVFVAAVIPAKAQQVPESPAQMQLTFAPLVKKTAPAVVNIYAKVKVRRQVGHPFFNDPFFNRFMMMPQMGGLVQERVENSLGSGVIVDPQGLIATNTHVVRGATEIVAVTQDGREFSAEKVLEDEKTDLAILRIKPRDADVPYVTFADSDLLEVGDLVLAIGNPFGVGQSVTSGIVSALGKTGVGRVDYGYFIQTDAAINPGNSGGALIDMQGRLVGINTMIVSKDGGSLGIGFAIPANMVKSVVEASRRGGKIVRPWTGVTTQPVTPDMTGSLGLDRAYGTLVNRVHPQGPAAKAGIKAGDVILSIDGRDVQDPEALKYRLATVGIGKDVTLKVLRNRKTFDVKMKTMPPVEDVTRDVRVLGGRGALTGATVANISPAVIDELGGLPVDEGVVVLKADQGIAPRFGIVTRDVILSVNGQKITNTAQLQKIAENASTRRWHIQIQRGAQVVQLNVML